jgi:hypothetical protein
MIMFTGFEAYQNEALTKINTVWFAKFSADQELGRNKPWLGKQKNS